MSDEREIDLASSSNRGSRNRGRSNVVNSNSLEKTVSFIDAKGRIWTVSMHLPANTTMTTMLEIAKANISLMNNQNDVQLSDLVVLIEPEDKDQVLYEDADRIVICHHNTLNKMEGR